MVHSYALGMINVKYRYVNLSNNTVCQICFQDQKTHLLKNTWYKLSFNLQFLYNRGADMGILYSKRSIN